MKGVQRKEPKIPTETLIKQGFVDELATREVATTMEKMVERDKYLVFNYLHRKFWQTLDIKDIDKIETNEFERLLKLSKQHYRLRLMLSASALLLSSFITIIALFFGNSLPLLTFALSSNVITIPILLLYRNAYFNPQHN